MAAQGTVLPDGFKNCRSPIRLKPPSRQRRLSHLVLARSAGLRTRSIDHAIHVEPATVLAHEAADFVQPLRTPADAAAGDELHRRSVIT